MTLIEEILFFIIMKSTKKPNLKTREIRLNSKVQLILFYAYNRFNSGLNGFQVINEEIKANTQKVIINF